MNDFPEKISFDELRRILRRRRWLVLQLIVVGAVAGILLAHASPREHAATSTVLIGTGSGSAAGPPGHLSAAVAARVLRTREVAKRVRRDLGDDRSVDELLAAVSAQPDDIGAFLNITARDDGGAAAAKLANAFAEQFISARAETVRSRTQDALAAARRRLAALPRGSVERATLAADVAQLRATASLGGFDAELIDPAVPEAAVTTGGSPARWGAGGAALGLLLGLVLAFSVEALDPRVRRLEELRRLVDAPQLAALPRLKSRSRLRRKPPVLRERHELFNHLRAGLLVRAGQDEIRRMMVTSPSDRSEGSAIVAANLALSFAKLGRRVCVVESDLRQPVLASHFGLDDAAPGLADAIRGEPVKDSVQHFALAPVAGTNGSRPGPLRLSVVAAGSPGPDRAADLLADERVERILDELGREHDIVIVACAPVLSASDVLPLLIQASGIVLVVRHSRTPRRAVARAEQVIRDARGSVLALAVTGVPKGELAADGYGPWPSGSSARASREN